jgi:hypothetical protein
MNLRLLLPARVAPVVVGLLASTVCLADGFDIQDSNQDGVLSGREAADVKMLDQDGDGEVSRTEFASAATAQRERAVTMMTGLMKERDKNEDGRLSGKEILGIEDCDANGDGRITEAELVSGYAARDVGLRGKSFVEIKKIAEDRFDKIDVTEDGRLSGTEAIGSNHFDQNADGRITKDEYLIGLILSTSNQDTEVESKPSVKEGPELIFNEVVAAMNDPRSAAVVHQRMHEKLKEVTKLCVLEYACHHALESHGKFKRPSKNQMKQTKLANGVVQVEANLPCPQGTMELNIQILKGKIIGLAMVSPEMNLLDKALFRDLQQDEWQNRFAEAYGQETEQVIKWIVSGKDDLAIQKIHPSVIKQIGREPFENVCRKLRAKINKVASLEIETFATDRGDNDIYTFTVTYLVKGRSSSVLFGCTFQRDGLSAVMTGLAVEELRTTDPIAPSADDIPPPPTPAPAPTPTATPKITKSEDGWIETVSIRDRMKFRMPGEAVRTESKNKGKTKVAFDVELPAKKMSFRMEVIEFDSDFSSQSAVYFKSYKNNLLKRDGVELMQEALESKAGFPLQVLGLKYPDGSVLGQLSMIDGKTLYLATWNGSINTKEGLNMAREFFESVVLIDAGGAPRTANNPNQSAEAPPAPTDPLTPELPPPPAPK